MLTRCYLEITNVCNLDCSFCPGHERRPRQLSVQEFDTLTDKLRGRVKFLYFHLMGEPCLHNSLPEFIDSARGKGLIPVLTTNGTRLNGRLLESLPYKINISLHAFEGNNGGNPRAYMDSVMDFSLKAAGKGCIVVLRLWNQGGLESLNREIVDMLHEYVPSAWKENSGGFELMRGLYIEFDSKFDWPDSGEDGEVYYDELFCYALRNQIGILSDGTAVPCCLDHNGRMPLGNLFTQSLEQILESDAARRIYNGFTAHKAVEPMCRKCGYAALTKRYRMD